MENGENGSKSMNISAFMDREQVCKRIALKYFSSVQYREAELLYFDG